MYIKYLYFSDKSSKLRIGCYLERITWKTRLYIWRRDNVLQRMFTKLWRKGAKDIISIFRIL